MHCHAGCDPADIVATVGLKLRDLYHEALPAQARRELAVQASRRGVEGALDHELTVLGMTLGRRVVDRQTPRDQMPDGWAAMPLGHWDREVRAVKRVLRLIPMVYGLNSAGSLSA